MTSNVRPSDALQDAVGTGVRTLSAVWWWFLILGVVWTLFGMYVLSYHAGSLAAVSALVGVAFLYGGVTELAAAGWARSGRWLFIVGGIVALAAGILTFVWPGITLYVVAILLAWYLIIFGIMHLTSALAGPKVGYWWTQLLLGVAELILGIWAVRSLAIVGADASDRCRRMGHFLWDGRDLRRILCTPGRQAGRAPARLTTS